LPDTCRGDDAPPTLWRASLSAGFLATELELGGSVPANLRETTTTASLSRRLAPGWNLQVGLGAVIDGTVAPSDGSYSIGPGPLIDATVSHFFLDGSGALPFVTAALTAAAATMETRLGDEVARFTPLDLKLSGVVGKTFWQWLSPYAGLAVFGGPIFWNYQGAANVGTDQHHFQVLLGLSASLPKGFDLYAEGSPLGERSIGGGVGLSF
jgi:hypothetical protein